MEHPKTALIIFPSRYLHNLFWAAAACDCMVVSYADDGKDCRAFVTASDPAYTRRLATKFEAFVGADSARSARESNSWWVIIPDVGFRVIYLTGVFSTTLVLSGLGGDPTTGLVLSGIIGLVGLAGVVALRWTRQFIRKPDFNALQHTVHETRLIQNTVHET